MPQSILVIDDEEMILKSVGRYLRRNGYNVEAVNNGSAAIEKIKHYKYDLIISDIRMPGMSGIETLKKIRNYLDEKRRKKIPVVIITGYSDEEANRQAAEISAVDYLYKPFELDEFIKLIRKNLEATPIYKRVHQRVNVDFPARIKQECPSSISSKRIPAKILNISEGGLALNSKEKLPKNGVLNIAVGAAPFSRSLSLCGKVAWAEAVDKSNGFRYGICFEELKESFVPILRDILFKYRFLDERFISLSKNLEIFVRNLKNELDGFDLSNNFDVSKQTQYIENHKKAIHDELDYKFKQVWDIVKDFPQDKYLSHQNYYQTVLGPLLLKPIEINRRVYEKPFGYSGDYVMMNYIFDYHKDNYLGKSLFQKIVNNYTCNIPISRSNIERKNYLKEKILETLQKNDVTKIVSLGSGSARELIELLKEGKVNKPLMFKCLDLEKQALDFVKTEVDKISLDKKRFLSIEYIYKDIISIIRDKKLQVEFKGHHLIYVSGVYDYLKDKMASALTKVLSNLLAKDGELIIINASSEKNTHRAYYELLGGWDLIYKTKEDMLKWVQDIQEFTNITFEDPSFNNKYLFLNIEK